MKRIEKEIRYYIEEVEEKMELIVFKKILICRILG
jgi:hypothetical protein